MWPLDWELEKHWKLVKSRRGTDTGINKPLYESEEETENLLFDEFKKELTSPY